MKKVALSVATATLLLGGLGACGNADDTGQQPNGVQTQWNESFDTPKYRGKGPVTEMLTPNTRSRMNMFGRNERFPNDRFQDRNFRPFSNGNEQMIENDGNFRGQNGPYQGGERRAYERNIRTKDRTFGAQQQGRMSRQGGYDSEYANRIAKHVNSIDGVDEAKVIVHEDDVVIGVRAEGRSDSFRDEVYHRVQRVSGGKNIHVVTDHEAFDRIQTMDDRLRSGGDLREMSDMFADLLRDIGDTAARPFERMAR